MESLELDNDRMSREQQRLVTQYRSKLEQYAKNVAELPIEAGGE